MNQKKIAVVGIGGVGGYLGALLAETYDHVSLVARGARKETLEKKGLILHSDRHGEITATPECVVTLTELEAQDYIFICVKNYSLEEVCKQLKHAVTENTIIIPVMNGVDPGDRVRELIGKGIVVDALIYIVAFANADVSVTQQGNLARLCIGTKGKMLPEVLDVAEILAGADIEFSVAVDIEAQIWRKYILNCAYNVATARYDYTIGQLRTDPQTAAVYENLVKEAYAVAAAKGVRVTKDDIDEIIDSFYHDLADDATSSLQRDVHAGKPSELETFSGYIVRAAAKLGIVVPVSQQMYEALKLRNYSAAQAAAKQR